MIPFKRDEYDYDDINHNYFLNENGEWINSKGDIYKNIFDKK